MFSETERIFRKAAAPSFIGTADRMVRSVAIAALLLVFAALPARAVHDPPPSLKIPLGPLGYQPMLPDLLASGSSMMTVNFAGKDRLLVTFGVRHLIQRDTSDPPEDYDHLVGAYYLELPSGKVLAQAEWRLHDRGQYLWNLGGGRFLLRVRDTLSLLEPGRAAKPEEALRGRPFLHTDRRIVAISVSAENDLLILETADRDQIVLGDSGQTASSSRNPVEISFYRLINSGGELVASAAGIVRAPVPLAIPVNSNGYVDAIEGKHDQWIFRYNTSADKGEKLAGFDTSCAPHPVFVSRAEFVAFGCRGSDDRQSMAGFTLAGDYMWQQGFFESYIAPSFEFAPEAGRFAMGRTLVSGGLATATQVSPSEITGQEIRVYQTYNGKVLLRLTCTPAVRAGQNFTLSPDGMQLAVLREMEVQHKATKDDDAYSSREAAVELYDLPALSKDDRAAIEDIRKLGVPSGQTQFELASKPGNIPDGQAAQNAAEPSASGAPAAGLPGAAGGNQSLQAAADSAGSTQVGDMQPTTPRKPPTLYAPDEKPDSKHPDQ